MSINKIKYIFFDLDHTLWDFETNSRKALEYIFHKNDLLGLLLVTSDKFIEVYEYHNDRLWGRFRKGFITREDLRWKRIWHTFMDLHHWDINLAKKISEQFLEILPQQTLLCDGTKEILDYCVSKNYKLHLITNGFENTQYEKLKNAGIESYFGEMICSEKANALKPSKEIFEFAEKKVNAYKEECLIIGDSPEADLRGAVNAQWKSIYYNPKSMDTSIPFDFQVQHLSQLKEIL